MGTDGQHTEPVQQERRHLVLGIAALYYGNTWVTKEGNKGRKKLRGLVSSAGTHKTLGGISEIRRLVERRTGSSAPILLLQVCGTLKARGGDYCGSQAGLCTAGASTQPAQ